ncbi:beta-xylosidase [Novosphingobium sp. SG751A]|uniref:glycoside hydrolase family 43 protein n=1 Tax=Novosphingobium sp. SG751A TaxID=2587000 RepID=UPI0015522892|nr:glycoside hydrolase 43 family protein [Novosphingobium sp. SG751A]NOW48430.1 beta-xylosidase [Novosphingobium sp. SG751A]
MASIALLSAILLASASPAPETDGHWIADQGNGTYRNPVLIGDWADPDVERVGDRFFLVASSFTESPGLPVLESRDLVNWTLIGHALPRLLPDTHYQTPRRGGGVWAPTIRYHNGRFMIYFPDPDRGIFLVTALQPEGPWSAPVLVDDTRGAIDPAPFWDEDGKGWLVHAYARSRAGFANRITLKPLNGDGTHTLGEGKTIIDGDTLPAVMTSLGPRPWQTTEGPKLYKRNGWYYVFAPSGSVKGGWQGVFRSRSIQGPYEGRDVLDQGSTPINGPHQGAWITTPSGENWFLHFQDRDTYGRVVHLEPMRWVDDWPVIGKPVRSSGRGEPVDRHTKPGLPVQPIAVPTGNDEFDAALSPVWSFNSNPAPDWARVSEGALHLLAVPGPADLFENGAVLSQRLPAPAFTATTRMKLSARVLGEKAGLAIHGKTFAWIGVEKTAEGLQIVSYAKGAAGSGQPVQRSAGPLLTAQSVWLKLCATPITVNVGPPGFSPYWPSMLREEHAQISLSYSLDGQHYTPLGHPFMTQPGLWVGARLGLFASAPFGTPSATATVNGSADFDFFRITAFSAQARP